MKGLLLGLLLSLTGTAHAQFGGSGNGFGQNIQFIIDHGTFTPTGTWDYQGPVIFQVPPVFVAGSSVATVAPLTGDGLPGTPIGVDSSSVTLQGNEFNGATQLVQLNGATKLPNVDGSLLFNIAATDVVLQARNNTGSLIPKGTAVYINGALGLTPTIALAIADSHDTSHTVGVTNEDINNNATGAVVQFGLIGMLDTSMFSEGVQLYLSTSTAGELTPVEPGPSQFVIHVGHVGKSNAVDGNIIVLVHGDHPQTGQVAGLTEAVRTTAELQTEGCTVYPAIRCLYYNTTDNDLYTSTGSAVGQWRNTRLGTGPGATP